MKKGYMIPEIKILKLSQMDVISTSGENGDNDEDMGGNLGNKSVEDIFTDEL